MYEQQMRQMEVQYRQAMMQQQRMMMNYFNQMLVQQNTQPQNSNGKVTRVQRVIIVPVPAYSFGLNMGSHYQGGHPHMPNMPMMKMPDAMMGMGGSMSASESDAKQGV